MFPRCGKQKSNSGKPFTEMSVKQHQRECRACIFYSKLDGTAEGLNTASEHKPIASSNVIVHDSTRYFDDEIPDGAYWALR